ncbi:glycosyltransferase family 4 protein [Candidatus Marifrigoribacter sp. Uisw_064]|jgi:glycosyltransferase involved in cell wall biosynthesis|uniref:glycosyltransferase family 4 protein n=1 Tax=Candidatus Marifrigoribacter sp. Uisw_064 TaxID=3230970 RepID=UPI003D425142
MKIGIVLPSVPAYSETFFSNKIKGLKEHGFTVVIFANSSKQNSYNLSKIKVASKLTGNKFQVILVSIYKLIHSFLFHFKNSKNLYSLDSKDGVKFPQRIKNIISNNHILSEPVDWLHFGFGTMVLNRENVAKAIGAKMAVSFRGFDIGVYPIKYPNCYLKLWEKVDKIHVISNDIKDLVYQHGFIGKAEIIKITPAIDTTFFKSEEEYIYTNKNNFITIARLHWKKGLVYTFEALAILKKEGIPFHYTIIGDGTELERLKFAAHQLNLLDEVTFTGKLQHVLIKSKLKSSDLYLQYSIQEGFCNSVLEAQALGLLCIVSTAEGLPENIVNNETGWVVPKCDSKELANKIIEVINLPEDKKLDIAKNAKERVSKHFTILQQQQQFVEFYKE